MDPKWWATTEHPRRLHGGRWRRRRRRAARGLALRRTLRRTRRAVGQQLTVVAHDARHVLLLPHHRQGSWDQTTGTRKGLGSCRKHDDIMMILSNIREDDGGWGNPPLPSLSLWDEEKAASWHLLPASCTPGALGENVGIAEKWGAPTLGMFLCGSTAWVFWRASFKIASQHW